MVKNSGGIAGKIFLGVVLGFFILSLFGLVGTVLVDSFGSQWFNSWLPDGFTTRWYQNLFQVHDVVSLIENTLFIALTVTAVALVIGFPAAYVLARKQFRFKAALTALYLVPMLVPPLAYGVPLATLLIRLFGQSMTSVIIINLVPVVPFVILILQPFIEQVDVSLENASAMLGANRLQTFGRVVLPLMLPGLLTAGMLAVVRTIAMFDLTFFTADANSQTLLTTIFGDAYASGSTPNQVIDGLAVIYMLTTMAVLGIALIFVKPTQFVVRVKTANNQ
jgi:putative spermidine/putrescine transport system permease protein